MSNVKGKCPICGAPVDPQYTPFCSKHCADVDLGRWLKGAYVVHTDEAPKDDTPPKEDEDE